MITEVGDAYHEDFTPIKNMNFEFTFCQDLLQDLHRGDTQSQLLELYTDKFRDEFSEWLESKRNDASLGRSGSSCTII